MPSNADSAEAPFFTFSREKRKLIGACKKACLGLFQRASEANLVEALQKLYKRVESFNGIIIETTGLSYPAPVVQTLVVDEDIKKTYKLDSIITVTDAKYIIERLDKKKPEGVENETVEQVAFADNIILNKTDLVKNEGKLEAIEARLRKLNPPGCDPSLPVQQDHYTESFSTFKPLT